MTEVTTFNASSWHRNTAGGLCLLASPTADRHGTLIQASAAMTVEIAADQRRTPCPGAYFWLGRDAE